MMPPAASGSKTMSINDNIKLLVSGGEIPEENREAVQSLLVNHPGLKAKLWTDMPLIEIGVSKSQNMNAIDITFDYGLSHIEWDDQTEILITDKQMKLFNFENNGETFETIYLTVEGMEL